MLKTLTAAAAAALCAAPALAQDPQFGDDASQDYAATLWDTMTEMRLAGDGRIKGFPYEGLEPHGFVLTTFYTEATIDGHTGELIVKNNYGPEGVAIEDVAGNWDEHFDSVTVMFRREDGYDPDHGNWFWAKYLPDGSLDQNPAGMALAGRVAKNAQGEGEHAGCIACHSGAGGDDFLFTTDAAGSMN